MRKPRASCRFRKCHRRRRAYNAKYCVVHARESMLAAKRRWWKKHVSE